MALEIPITPSVQRGENSQYEVKDYVYPIDLFNTQAYGANYVMFYINVNQDSKIARETADSGFVAGVVRDARGELVGLAERNNVSRGELFGANVVANAGGAVIANAFGIGGAGATTAALATAGQAALGASSGTSTRAQKRLKTAIAMHVPNQMQIRYGMQWSEEETLLLSGILGVGNEIGAALSGQSNSNLMGEAGGLAAAAALRSGPNAAANSALTGLAVNPKKEQTFKGINYREFSMEYQFFPRSREEADNVREIIYQFKYHMHPEFKDTSSFLYVYPSEFDIAYFSGGSPNQSLHKHTSCVLTDMAVNYTPNGNFATFDDATGMPVQINLVLSFRELALLTKEKIEKGY